MIGVVVVFEEHGSVAQVIGADRELLGAPVLARAIASAVPAEREAQVVVVVPEAQLERVREDVVRRFGLVEVIEVMAWHGDLRATLEAALERLGEGIELVLLHDGRRPLVTHALCQSLIAAALQHGAAAPVLALDAPCALQVEGALQQVPAGAVALQSPVAAQREQVQTALQHARAASSSLYSLLLDAGLRVVGVEGDRDNLRLRDEADLSRAIEVWSRRAIDFPFLWPRPDRFEELEREAAEEREASSGAVASASIDQMLASGTDEDAAPFDRAMASLEDQGPGGDDADSNPGEGSGAGE